MASKVLSPLCRTGLGVGNGREHLAAASASARPAGYLLAVLMLPGFVSRLPWRPAVSVYGCACVAWARQRPCCGDLTVVSGKLLAVARAAVQDVAVERCNRGRTLTTLENRPNTALLVVDVQNGVVAEAHERDAVVANVGSLVEKARREQVPVIWVQHSSEHLEKGSDKWRIVPELTPDDAEPLVEKNYGDSFEDTNLETVLSDLGVGRLVVVGAETDACIRSTLHGALVRGYDATLVSDAHTTEDQSAWGAPSPDLVIAHTNLYWTYQTAPGRTAGTVVTSEVDFSR